MEESQKNKWHEFGRALEAKSGAIFNTLCCASLVVAPFAVGIYTFITIEGFMAAWVLSGAASAATLLAGFAIIPVMDTAFQTLANTVRTTNSLCSATADCIKKVLRRKPAPAKEIPSVLSYAPSPFKDLSVSVPFSQFTAPEKANVAAGLQKILYTPRTE